MSHIARRGATVITDNQKHVHVSGHASAEELKLVLSLIKPRYFVPVHGEYRQLAEHSRMAKRVMGRTDRKLEVLLAQDGDIIQFDQNGARISDKAPTGRVLIDATRTGEVADEVLRDRRYLAGDGSSSRSWRSVARRNACGRQRSSAAALSSARATIPSSRTPRTSSRNASRRRARGAHRSRTHDGELRSELRRFSRSEPCGGARAANLMDI